MVLQAWTGPWILEGEFNCTQTALERTRWLELVRIVIHAPSSATSNSKTIDFFVGSESFTHAIKGVHVLEETSSFPHSAVRCS